MLLEEIDRVLPVWKRDLPLIESNVLELNDLLSYQVLSGGAVGLIGRSAAELPPILSSVEQLSELLRLMQGVIQRASGLRGSLPLLGRGQVLAEIAKLLTGPSVVLPAQEVPLAQRGLLSASERDVTMTLEQAKQAMARSFDRARATFIAIDKRWAEGQEQLDELRRKAAEIKKQSGTQEIREVARLSSIIDSAEDHMRKDPLGFSAPEEFVRPFLREARGAMTELQQRQGVIAARREELSQHRARADKLAERGRAAGQVELPAVSRLLSSIAELEKNLAQENLSMNDLLHPLFRQARDAVQVVEANEARGREWRSALENHAARADELKRAASTKGLIIPVLDKLHEALQGLRGQLAKDPTGFTDPAEFLAPFFTKAKQALETASQEGEKASAELTRAQTQHEKLLSLYTQAHREATTLQEARITWLSPLPQEPKTGEALARADAAIGSARWEEARRELSLIASEYGQTIGTLRAFLAEATPLSTILQKIKLAKEQLQTHNLQNDKPLQTYITKINELLNSTQNPETREALVDNINRLMYALETRIGELLSSR